MPAVLPRFLAAHLERALEASPVVVLTGARQTGKSTLVQSTSSLENWPYLTLDRFDILEQAQRTPDELVRRSPRMILDEVQRAPELMLAIKRRVDETRPRRRVQFVLTGSANLLLMQRISETLAGRATYLTLWPLTRGERRSLGRTGRWTSLFEMDVEDWLEDLVSREAEYEDWRDLVRVGGYPTPAHELDSDEQRSTWFAGYVETYVQRDLQVLSAIENLVDFRRLMVAVCLRLGNLVNQTELGRDTGLAQPTVRRYLNLLETSYQMVRIPAFAVNRTKRLIKTPKVYWSDTGLALALSGEREPRGADLENMIFTDLLAWRSAATMPTEIAYWRTASGQEVDFVVERGRELLAIEVKATERPRHRDAGNLRTFLEEYPRKSRGALLLHTGDETFWIGERILAVPWWRIL